MVSQGIFQPNILIINSSLHLKHSLPNIRSHETKSVRKSQMLITSVYINSGL